MAAKKKRSVAKKKKSVAKKKRSAAKTTRSAARAKGTTKRRRCTGPPKTHTFRYFCGGKTCGVTPRVKHMCPGDTADLVARGTDVTITFRRGSPFVSGTNPIHLTDGVPKSEVVASTRGRFRYDLDCTACSSVLHIPPEMIVP